MERVLRHPRAQTLVNYQITAHNTALKFGESDGGDGEGIGLVASWDYVLVPETRNVARLQDG